MFFNVYTCFQISQTHQIPFTCNQIASYLAAQSDALTLQCQTLHLPATKLPLTSQRQAMRLPCNAKHCTYLQRSALPSYLAAQSDALTLQCLALHLPATPRVAITFLQRKALQKPPPQSCPSHISTYHSPCVQPPVR